MIISTEPRLPRTNVYAKTSTPFDFFVHQSTVLNLRNWKLDTVTEIDRRCLEVQKNVSNLKAVTLNQYQSHKFI